MSDLRTEIRAGVLIGDGAMGTQLQLAGLEPGSSGDLWNLEHPERVLEIQLRYAQAGAHVLLTNTFGANAFVLGRYDAAARVAEVNAAGVAIARRAASESGAFVLGDIGPFGGFLAPIGEYGKTDVYAAFYEQAVALVGAGVDGIVIETMTALDELSIAVRAARAAGAPLVIGSLAFEATRAGLRTMMGATPQAAVETLLASGADALGANCGTKLTFSDMADVVTQYRSLAPTLPIMVQPNAGQPKLVGDDIVYDQPPKVFAEGAAALIAAGASLVGGCCGTTPDHIRELARVVAQL
jgi:5-methyltetrahydrofolate--homocysteine methyltransferase